MRQLHNLFHMPEDEQVTEKYLRRVLISSLCTIALCMSCLIGSTWAWFQTTIVNEGNVITIGEVQVAVALRKGGESDGVSITPSEAYTYELEEVGTYYITVTNTGSIPGYCEIKLTQNGDGEDDSVVFSSGTLYPKESGTNVMDSATIMVKIDAEDVYNGILPITLKITPHWGEDPTRTVASVSEEVFTSEEDEASDDSDPTKEAEDSDSSESTEETKAPDSTESIESTEGSGSSEPTEETKAPDSTESTESTEGADSSEPTEETKAPDSTESTESTEGADSSEPTEETKAPDGTESTEGTEGADGSEPSEETKAPDSTESPEGTQSTPDAHSNEGSGETQTTESTPSAESQPGTETE